MARFSEMPGKRILNNHGTLLGTVRACVTEPYCSGILGYRCEALGDRPGTFYVRQDQVAYISDRYLGLKPAFVQDQSLPSGDRTGFSPLGLAVYSARGGAFGRVGDLTFSEETGRFQSVVLSEGLMRDLIFGRRRLHLTKNMSIKNDGLLLTGPIEISEESYGGLLNHLGRRG